MIELSNAESEYLDRVRAFSQDVVAPAASQCSGAADIDSAIQEAAANLGLFGIEVPAEHGGLGYGFSVKARVCEVLAGADFGFAMSVINTQNVALRLSREASTGVQERWLQALLEGKTSSCTALTEPGAGSDLSAMQSTARQVDGGWSLNGEKTWIVNGRRAGLAIVYARCTDEVNADAGALADTLAAFAVDTSATGVESYAIDSHFSQHALASGGLRMHDVVVSEDAMILPPGRALKSILLELNCARVYLAAMCCGMLSEALAQVSGYGEQRASFGVSLFTHQSWRFYLSRALVDLEASRSLLERAIHTIETGNDAQRLAAISKVHAVDICQKHLPALLHAMGAEGLRSTYCFARHVAASQFASLTDGSTEMLLERIARLSWPNAIQSNSTVS